jgi:endonuclease/exonuclease/phosphatase (EEP) superfamily protein YafD
LKALKRSEVSPLLLRKRRAARVTACFVLFSVLLLASVLLPKHPVAAQEADAISILSYNVSDDNRQVDELILWLSQQEVDVLALQEVSLDWHERLVTALAAGYPYHGAFADDTRWRANVTFSRTPFLQTETLVELESLRTRLCLNNRAVDFYNIGLDTPFPNVPQGITGISFLDLSLQVDEEHQIEQVEQLLAALDEAAAPVILAGDFNLTDESVSYRALTARLTDSFSEAGSGSGLTWPAAARYDLPGFIPPLLRIDYVWHDEQFLTRSASVADGAGSDHLPVRVQLGYAPGAVFPACSPA